MQGFWLRMAAALSCLAALLLSSLAAEAADRFIDVSNPSVHKIFLPMSQSVTIQVNANLGDIVVGDEKIADAQPMTDRTLYVIGKGAGTTTVNLFSTDKRSLGVIQIEVGVDVSDMAQAIRQVAPKARIEIGSINGKVRLGGHVKDGATLASILEVAQHMDQAIINSVIVDDSQQSIWKSEFSNGAMQPRSQRFVRAQLKQLDLDRNPAARQRGGGECGRGWSVAPFRT